MSSKVNLFTNIFGSQIYCGLYFDGQQSEDKKWNVERLKRQEATVSKKSNYRFKK